MTLRPLPHSFYERNPRVVARELLGKLLVRHELGGHILSGRIVETEAYLGSGDRAAHATAGLTERNSVIFGPAGHAYVYRNYGKHYCLNISCLPDGKPGCVLLRALEPLGGVEEMARRRGLELPENAGARKRKLLASGPGRICQSLDISRERDNAKDLTLSQSDLQVVEGDGFEVGKILATPRIGIVKSPELKLRFTVAGNPYLSR